VITFVVTLIIVLTFSTFVVAQYTGTIRVGTVVIGNEPGGTAQYRQVIGSATTIGKVIKAAASQTADFVVMQNSTPNTIFQFTSTASMVNGIQFNPANTGSPSTVSIAAIGTDPDININLISKGAGSVQVNGGAIGSTAPTITTKTGSGAGDYTTISATYVRVDTTNLAYTVTVPVGQKMTITVQCVEYVTVNTNETDVALADGTADNTGILREAFGGVAGNTWNFPVNIVYVFVGDGASHTFNLQHRVVGGTARMRNATSTVKPYMIFSLGTAN